MDFINIFTNNINYIKIIKHVGMSTDGKLRWMKYVRKELSIKYM